MHSAGPRTLAADRSVYALWPLAAGCHTIDSYYYYYYPPLSLPKRPCLQFQGPASSGSSPLRQFVTHETWSRKFYTRSTFLGKIAVRSTESGATTRCRHTYKR